MSPILRPRLILPNRGFNPPAISNLLMWFDAQRIPGVDGVAIAQWDDVSGHGNHGTQGTSGNRPTLKRNQLGGMSAVKFNVGGGTTQYLDLPNVMGAPTGAELFIVMQSDADPAASALAAGAITLSNNVGDQALPFTNGNIYETFGSSANTHTNIAKAINLATTARLYNVAAEASHYTMRLNGTCIHDSSAHTMSFAGATRSIGRGVAAGSTYWRGYIYEILVYNKRLSYMERAVVQNYLATKYNITSAVAAIGTPVTPASFSGLAMWYKADQLGLNDGDLVASWSDQSGNSRTLTAAGAARPTFKSAGLNSLNSVRFTTSNSLALASDLVIGASTSLTGIVVASYSADCSVIGHPTDNVQFRARRGNINVQGMFDGSGEAVSATFPRSVGAAYMGVWRRNGGSTVGNFFNNGDESAVTAGSSAGAFKIKSLGGNPFGISMAGDISEFCVWSGSYISNADIYNLYEMYFRDRWALP